MPADTENEIAPVNRLARRIAEQTVQQMDRNVLLAVLKHIGEDPRVPATLANSARATLWLIEVDAFRKTEEDFMVDGRYDEMLPDHREHLSALIAKGESIIFAIRNAGIDLSVLHCSEEDLRATLESLHRTFRHEHGPRNSEKTNEQIASLFHVPKS